MLVLAATASLAAGALTVGHPATAEPPEGPAEGTCKTFDDPQVMGWTTYAELGPRLTEIEKASDGRVDVDVVGQTQRGRDLYAARVGTGDRVLLVQSAIHGNERTGTEALLGILKDLGTSQDAATLETLRNITIVAMPMVNPDGGELNRRMNAISWDEVAAEYPQLAGAPRAWYHRLSGDGIDQPGFDLNRDFNADLDYVPRAEDLPGEEVDAGFYLSPESRAIRDMYVGLQREFGTVDAFVDLHHMGPCDRLSGGEQDGRHISVSLDYPPLGVNDGAAYQDQWPALDQGKSRRLALAAANGIKAAYGTQSPLAAVGRYFHPDAREFAGQARCAFALNGTGTVLFEVRGQSDDIGPKLRGMLVQSVRTGVEGIVDGLATDSVDTLDGDAFFDLPDYGWEESD
ncbi:MAG: M14 family zinc carboxypeptidase [Actinomycetes bacterium]